MKLALRRLLAAPVFSCMAMGSIALAVALVCSIFAIVQSVYLATPPLHAPDRLIDIWQTASPASDRAQDYVQPVRAEEWVARNDFRFIEGLAAIGMGAEGVLALAGGPARIEVRTVLGDWFGITGVEMARGRGLTMRDAAPDAEAAAVVSHDLWSTHLGERLGTIRLNDRIFQVVGVISDALPVTETVWLPVAHAPARLAPVAYAPTGRLRSGARVDHARMEIGQLARAQVAADSIRYAGFGATVTRHGAAGREGFRTSSWLVLGVLFVVLLLGLSNLVHLFLLRVRGEAAGLSIRGALGGRPIQAGSHLAWEAVLLSLAGCGAGLLLAFPGTDLAWLLLRSEVVPRAAPRIGTGTIVVAVTIASFVAGALALEALRFARKQARRPVGLGGGSSGSSAPERRFAQGVLVTQSAASVVLVATLLVLRAAHAQYADLEVGYDAENVVMADPDFDLAGIPAEGSWEVANRILEPLNGGSWVNATAWRFVGMNYPPQPAWDVVVEGGAPDMTGPGRLYGFYEVAAGFFETLSMPIIDGRPLRGDDHAEARAVAVVTRSAARHWWPGEPAVGHRLRIGDGAWLTVVGVSGDVQRLDWLGRTVAIRGRFQPLVFVPAGLLDPFPTGWRVYDFWGDVKLAVRGSDPTVDDTMLRGAISAGAPGLPVRRLGTMRDLQVAGNVGPDLSMRSALVASGGAVSLILVLLGTVGLVAGSLQQRRGELGVRVALGAGPGHVLWLVAVEGIRAVAVGLAAGAAGVWLLQRFVGLTLFGPFGGRLTEGFGLGAVAAGMAAVIVVTVAASVTAARPAAMLQPARILRAD